MGLSIGTLAVDINCDMGEGMPNDEELMPFISSANIACGGHAGDNDTINQTIALCLRYGVAVGAHPSFSDRQNFGRTEMQLGSHDLYELLVSQLENFKTIAENMGAVVHHVKPHGALYNMAARDKQISAIIAKAVSHTDRNLVLYGLAGSFLLSEGRRLGLQTASEVFADRGYRPDGSLVPRSMPGAMVEGEEEAATQVLKMVQQQTVTATDGSLVAVQAGTVCIHGDGKNAVRLAKIIHGKLIQHGIVIRAV